MGFMHHATTIIYYQIKSNLPADFKIGSSDTRLSYIKSLLVQRLRCSGYRDAVPILVGINASTDTPAISIPHLENGKRVLSQINRNSNESS